MEKRRRGGHRRKKGKFKNRQKYVRKKRSEAGRKNLRKEGEIGGGGEDGKAKEDWSGRRLEENGRGGQGGGAESVAQNITLQRIWEGVENREKKGESGKEKDKRRPRRAAN